LESFWRALVKRKDREGRRAGGRQPGGEGMSGFYALKWVWLATAIGVVAGLGALLSGLLVSKLSLESAGVVCSSAWAR